MGYHPSCSDQTCVANCCDYSGQCPIPGTTYCTYYYGNYDTTTVSTYNDSVGLSVGLPIGLGFGITIFIIIIIVLVCRKKCQNQNGIGQNLNSQTAIYHNNPLNNTQANIMGNQNGIRMQNYDNLGLQQQNFLQSNYQPMSLIPMNQTYIQPNVYPHIISPFVQPPVSQPYMYGPVQNGIFLYQ